MDIEKIKIRLFVAQYSFVFCVHGTGSRMMLYHSSDLQQYGSTGTGNPCNLRHSLFLYNSLSLCALVLPCVVESEPEPQEL
jgi:hypothetical protein